MNHSGRVPSQVMNGDQSALSLLVNAAENRDAPRGQRESNSAIQRSLAETLRSRGLASDGGPSLEDHLMLQQQSQNSYGGQGNLLLLSQLRDQNLLLSQLGQQQQLASLLGLGGGSSQSPDVRQLIAAQLRQSQAQQQLTNADLLALRSGAIPGLSNFFGGNGFGGQGGANFPMGGGFGAGQSGFGSSMTAPSLSSDIENLQRLEEFERRQRLLAQARGSASPAIARQEASAPPPPVESAGTEQRSASRAETSQTGRFKPAQSPVVEATTAPESNKDELEKTPGSVIVPCRARGMPMDHNFKTAFFVIPENVKHGEELICSYFACRNAGIKFRYCSHCKVPVAKRNFRKRHKHGGEKMVKGADDDSGDEASISEKRGIPSQITANREEVEEADGLSSQSPDSTNVQDNKPKHVLKSEKVVEKTPTKLLERVAEVPKKEASNAAAALEGSVKPAIRICDERRQRWIELLARRPSTQEGDSMSGWLLEVLAVSDLETPLNLKSEVTDDDDSKINQEKIIERNNEPDQKRSEKGPKRYNENSSNDDSADMEEKLEQKERSSSGAFGGSLVKRKRPAVDVLRDVSEPQSTSNAFPKGSFAEWRERKKQNKQSKSSGSTPK